jgi:hypothetical protein
VTRFIHFLIAARWPLFIVGLLLAAVTWFPAQHVSFDRSIEKMFAANDPLLAPYERLKRDFGGNEIVLAVYRDEQLLAPDGSGLQRLSTISQRLKNVPGVRDVLSLAQINELLTQLERGKRLGGLLDIFRPADAWKGPAILDPESKLAARYRDLFAGLTHAADGRTVSIVCMLEPQASAEELDNADGERITRAATLAELEDVVHDLPNGFAQGVLAGEPVMVARGFALLEQDGQRLGTWTTILLGVTILLFFRSLRWLVVPIAVVQWSLLVTQAILVGSGLALSMVSSMLTAIVTVVGVATVMHLIVHVREMRTQGLTQRAALAKAAILLAGPIVGAILTDVAGFGSLWCASVEPIRDFGTMMVIGSLAVIPAICLLVPALGLVGSRDLPVQPGWGEVQLGYWLMRSIAAVQSHPRTVAIVAGTLTVAAALGTVRLDVETDFTRNFRRGSAVVEAYEFVETQLGGAGVWDVIVPAPPTLTEEYLARVRELESDLRELESLDPQTGRPAPALTKVISLVDALDAIEVDPPLAALTPTPELRYRGLATAMPAFMAALRSQELDEHGQGRLRIMLRAAERQPAAQKQQLIQEVTRLAREHFPARDDSAGAEVTGFFVLLTNLIQSMLRDQWVTFGVASAAIAALVWIGFGSWRFALIALIPNAAPIYVLMGVMGWLGLRINMGAAMIAAVSMGMSVDSSIHYFSAYRRARRAGMNVPEALAQCQHSVGLAMIFSTIALICGFGVLITSHFVPTIYFGALMSLAMLGGMLGNLIVLPLLLLWSESDSSPSKLGANLLPVPNGNQH